MAIADQCQSRNVPLTVLGYNRPDEWLLTKEMRSVPNFTLRSQSGLSRITLLRSMCRNSHVALVGADMIDGCYSESGSLWLLRLLESAALTGSCTELIGCSFNEDAPESIVDALSGLSAQVHLRARDAVSLDRLVRRSSARVELTADVAFLLRPDEEGPSAARAIQWIKKQKNSGKTVLGINLSKSVVDLRLSDSPAECVRLLATVLRSLLSEVSVSVLLIPHDDRGEWSDCALAAGVAALLQAEFPDRVSVVEFPISAAEIKGIAGYLDAVFSGRMHLAIACLGRGTPVACFDYQDKFEGLYQHFGLNGLLLSCKGRFPTVELSDVIRRILRDHVQIAGQISARLPGVLNLAEKNLSFLNESIGSDCAGR